MTSRLSHRQPGSYRRSATFLVLLSWYILQLAQPALADCECGYLLRLPSDDPVSNARSVSSSSSSNDQTTTLLFTDLIETDFSRLAAHSADTNNNNNNNNANYHSQERWWDNTDWIPQAFNLTRERARGEYGEMFAVENARLFSDAQHSTGKQKGVTEEGLELVVRSDVVDGMVPVAELDTARLDLRWGTFRAGMKLSSVPGTCAAFFWYFNDTQEIDMEFLTKDFHRSNNSYPVNLVLQSRESALAGFDAAHPAPSNDTTNNTNNENENPNFVLAYLPFDPTAGFHEYRIDYLPDRVLFFADGQQLASMAGSAAVPTTPGHLILQHWSNGNPLWSGGPPSLAAAKALGDPDGPALEVRYVKAYFNSSTIIRDDDGSEVVGDVSGEPQQKWEGEAEYNSRCRDPKALNAVCEIPEVTPQDASAASWFFGDHPNMTHGIVKPPGGSGGDGDGDSAASRVMIMGMAWITVLVSGWLVVL